MYRIFEINFPDSVLFSVVSIERLRGSNSDEYNEEDEEIELEIVEVEELEEPVPTQDSCLQVCK